MLLIAQTLITSTFALKLDDSMPGCNSAMFPQVFGSTEGTNGEKLLAVDVYVDLNTVVAGGYFTDKQLARDETGAFDTGFQDLSKDKYPIIGLYPMNSEVNKKANYHTVRYDGADAFLDVAVL